ncbi:MAG: GreA/GreB family elongation factor [Planctomycetes bacterium]|nr:GreA/GreB family elongation factor [Planctomycetota bacterium]
MSTKTMTSIDNALKLLADRGSIDEFAKVWRSALADEHERAALVKHLPGLFTAVETGDRATKARASELAHELFERLEKEGEARHAIRALQTVARKGTEPTDARARLKALVEQAHADDGLASFALQRAKLEDPATALHSAIDALGELARWREGAVVWHSAGWNEGQVMKVSSATGEFEINYIGGHKQKIKIEFALTNKSITVLEDSDLRAMRMVDKEGLLELAEKDPCAVIRKVCEIHLGKASTQILKDELYDRVIPASKWNAWWKDARAKALNDPWLAPEGQTTRPTYALRAKPLSLADEAVEMVGRALSVSESIQRARHYLSLDLGAADARARVLERVHKMALRDERMLRATDPAQLLDAALYLEKEGAPMTEITARSLFEQAKEKPGAFAALLGGLSSPASRKDALDHLKADLPDGWVALLLGSITSFGPELAEVAVDRLVRAKVFDGLREVLSSVIRKPEKAPAATLALLRAVFHREIPMEKGWHGEGEVLIALMRLAVAIESRRRDIPKAAAMLRSLVQLAQSKGQPFFEACSQAELDGLTAYTRMPALEPELKSFVKDQIELHKIHDAESLAAAAAAGNVGFWEGNTIFSTEQGIARRREELRLLTDVKIPENSEAIRRAAGFGDLSENAEWDAAMEEQRLLTQKAEELSAELKNCADLSLQTYEPGVVAPGTKVRFVELKSGNERTVSILGPWDIGVENVISYRAPLALGLLKRKAGEEVEIELPGGQQTVRVLEVENLCLHDPSGS